MNEDLKQIKKYYGEKMMHLCRTLFPTILEEEGVLIDTLLKTFEPNHFLYDDLTKTNHVYSFRDYIYATLEPEEEVKEEIEPKNPSELMSMAGYKLYECHTEEDIQRFKRYYEKDEQLCTFNGGRLNRCYVFFAVKDNASELKRKNFKDPKREDEYGTSVISIQFSRGNINTLSIKNRYNHTVDNPDATFSNNLDNIIGGLTNSFRCHYKLNFNRSNLDFNMPGYVKASDGKFYPYTYERNNVYYCHNNIIIDNFEVNRDYTEKERYILFDYFILDLKEKTIKLYDESLNDSFVDAFNNIDKIYVKKDSEGNKEIIIIIPNEEEIIIKINKYSQMKSYKNNIIKEIGDRFLEGSYMETIEMNNVVKIGNYFLRYASFLREISLSKVESVGDFFIEYCNELNYVNMPMVKYVGNYFLKKAPSLVQLELPNILSFGNTCLSSATNLQSVYLPKVEKVGTDFMSNCWNIKSLDFPSLRFMDYCSLECCDSLEYLNMPKVEQLGSCILTINDKLQYLNMPNITKIGSLFLNKNKIIDKSIYKKQKFKNNYKNLFNMPIKYLKKIVKKLDIVFHGNINEGVSKDKTR